MIVPDDCAAYPNYCAALQRAQELAATRQAELEVLRAKLKELEAACRKWNEIDQRRS